MTTKRRLGFLMVALPFILMGTLMTISIGIWQTLGVFGGVGLLVGWILWSMKLVFSEGED